MSKPGQLDSLLNSARKDFEEDGDENIVPFFSLSEKPQIDRSVNPEYPKAARKKKIGGRVVIMVLVDEEGNVEEAEIIKSPDQLLNEPTIEAVKQWKFSPGKQGDNPVKVWLKIPIDFSLKK